MTRDITDRIADARAVRTLRRVQNAALLKPTPACSDEAQAAADAIEARRREEDRPTMAQLDYEHATDPDLLCTCDDGSSAHTFAAHTLIDGVYACAVPECACGPGCIHEGFVPRDGSAAPPVVIDRSHVAGRYPEDIGEDGEAPAPVPEQPIADAARELLAALSDPRVGLAWTEYSRSFNRKRLRAQTKGETERAAFYDAADKKFKAVTDRVWSAHATLESEMQRGEHEDGKAPAPVSATADETRALKAKLGAVEVELMALRKDRREHDCAATLLEHTPDGTRIAYLCGEHVIVTGTPPDSDDEETGHNCDAMGCGTFSHVVERHRIAPVSAPALCEVCAEDLTDPRAPGCRECAPRRLVDAPRPQCRKPLPKQPHRYCVLEAGHAEDCSPVSAPAAPGDERVTNRGLYHAPGCPGLIGGCLGCDPREKEAAPGDEARESRCAVCEERGPCRMVEWFLHAAWVCVDSAACQHRAAMKSPPPGFEGSGKGDEVREAAPTHDPFVARVSSSRWRAECLCGWTGTARGTKRAAGHDRDDHAEESAVLAGGESNKGE